MKKKVNLSMISFSVVSLFFLCIGFTIKTFQNDTFYMIKLGESILHSGIDFFDHYCWITRLPYTYPHWLYDIYIYIVYRNFGNIGIYFNNIVSFFLLIFSIYFINYKNNHNFFLAFFVSVLSIFCLSPFVTARSQVFSLILFLWEVYFIERLIVTGKNRYILYLIVISLLIANLHATVWLFCFVLYCPFIFHQIINFYFKNRKVKANEKIKIFDLGHFKKLILAFFCSFFVGIFTPSRICYTYVFKIMLGDSQKFIFEHAPMVIVHHILFLVLVVLFLLLLISRHTYIKLYELFMILGILLMSLISIRHLSFFYTIGLLYISKLCVVYLNTVKDDSLIIITNLLSSKILLQLGILTLIIFLSLYQFQNNFKKDYFDKKSYPVDAVKYIKKNLKVDSMKLYNNYNYGSYLLFNDIPVFIDSRCDLYLKEFNGMKYSIFDIDRNIYATYETHFKKFGVTHILASKDDILYFILIKDDDYKLLYQDKYFSLFERAF